MGLADCGYGHSNLPMQRGCATFAEFVTTHSQGVADEVVATMDGEEVTLLTRGTQKAVYKRT